MSAVYPILVVIVIIALRLISAWRDIRLAAVTQRPPPPRIPEILASGFVDLYRLEIGLFVDQGRPWRTRAVAGMDFAVVHLSFALPFAVAVMECGRAAITPTEAIGYAFLALIVILGLSFGLLTFVVSRRAIVE